MTYLKAQPFKILKVLVKDLTNIVLHASQGRFKNSKSFGQRLLRC